MRTYLDVKAVLVAELVGLVSEFVCTDSCEPREQI
jgi:hypothetical protein